MRNPLLEASLTVRVEVGDRLGAVEMLAATADEVTEMLAADSGTARSKSSRSVSTGGGDAGDISFLP